MSTTSVFSFPIAILFIFVIGITSQNIEPLFRNCQTHSPSFNECLKEAFNHLNPLFKYGLPEYGVAPFDPHKSPYVELRRGDDRTLGGYKLVLKDVSEYGWTQSWVTKVKMNWDENQLIYSQQFPEKSLDGLYDFRAKLVGQPIHTKGVWNLTLYDYSQTTTVTRVGGPGGLLKVRVEIDKIGDMKLHISDLLGGRRVMESIADFLTNNAWQLGFPFVRPMINELVSTAFTDIFNESFRKFPLDQVIRE